MDEAQICPHTYFSWISFIKNLIWATRSHISYFGLELPHLYFSSTSCCWHCCRKLCDSETIWNCLTYIQCHTKIVWELFRPKYCPLNLGFYRCLEGKIEVAKAVTKLPLDLICFTGSTMTGRLVAIEAAKNLTPCLLELGGKCPTIVDQSAKISNAVLRILAGKYLNCGQTCVGVDHVYVHESLYKEFKKAFL